MHATVAGGFMHVSAISGSIDTEHVPAEFGALIKRKAESQFMVTEPHVPCPGHHLPFPSWL